MREVFTVSASGCDGCPYECFLVGHECWHPDIPRNQASIFTYMADTVNCRHRDCPYGNRVITVVMTDEEET